MGDDQTWRVGLEGGGVETVTARQITAHRSNALEGDEATDRAVVMLISAANDWDAAEILAPGALSRGEALAAERARVVTICDEVAATARATVTHEDDDTDLRGEVEAATAQHIKRAVLSD
jgi:hypothetical protein